MKDTELKRAILAALATDERLSSQPIGVRVEAGRVTLSGEVQSFRRKLAAQEVALAIAGEEAIDNALEVRTPENPIDEDIGEDVRALIDEHVKLAKESVVVEVRAGRVTLSGSVATDDERTLVGDVALQAPGARHVSNQLTIEAGARAKALVLGTQLQGLLASARSLEDCEVAVVSGTATSREQVEIALGLVRKAWVGELRNEVVVAET